MQCLIDILSEWTGIKAIPSILSVSPKDRTVLLDVPSYSQVDSYSCGATAAWAIVETFKPRARFDRLYNLVSPIPDCGVGPTGVIRALRKTGIRVGIRSGLEWPDIVRIVDQGYPMLIGTGKENPDSEGDHWSVLYGYGTRPKRVFLGNQPGIIRNQVELSWGEFSRSWWNPRGKALVCSGK